MSAITNEGYFRYLMRLLDDKNSKFPYKILCRFLHDKEWYSVVARDENREEDGLDFRAKFARTIRTDWEPDLGGPVSVLEVFLGISYRFAFLVSSSYDLWPVDCFKVMLKNLKLDKMTDDIMGFSAEKEEVDEIIETLLDRTYDYNGTGGLFPVQKPIKNMKKVEIWYQLNQFLIEKYPI